MAGGLIQRGSTWYLKRRVPLRFRGIEPREVIWESLKTDSKAIAQQKMERVWSAYLDGWEARLEGRDAEAQLRFRAAKGLADRRGYAFLAAKTVSELPLVDLLERVEDIPATEGTPDPQAAEALLGGVEAPALRLSGLVEHVEGLLAHDNRFKNASQMRIWRAARTRAVANLVAALGGDRPVAEVGPAEAQQHKRWWKERRAREGQTAATANKDFFYLSGLLKAFHEDLETADPPRPYAGVSIRDRHERVQRKKEVPLETVRDGWLAEGALDGLNDEARDILLISLETGCRQSEITDLPASAFRLEARIPHLRIANEAGEAADGQGRDIKNLHSTRLVPLVGLALAAARRHPEGFARYRDSRTYSATVNKYLRQNDLLPEGVTVGGLRHLWETRLKAIGVDTDDRGEIMGHSVREARGREVYGDEMALEVRRDIIARVALPVPEHLG